ncbi:MAG: ferrous iron transport protein A [Candidatus Bathyarchaeota archaeon]|nr:ferrous iron transport protein A [Candidatus Bathyarchaeota archaeon]
MDLPLNTLSSGTEAKITKIIGGCGLIKRLTEMGLTHGTQVKVVSEPCGGPVLIEVRDTRLALGRGVAMKIFVEE